MVAMQESTRARAQKALTASIFLVFFTLLSALPLCSCWVGLTSPLAFSARHCIAPLAGMYLGGILTFLLYTIKALFALLTGGIIHLLTLANYLPSLRAAGYLAIIAPKTNTVSLRTGASLIPLACFMLFLAHPIGAQAPAYTLIWLIPLITSWFPTAPFFVKALAGTCVAHAIGSTIWLYAGLIPDASILHQLMPLVIIERLFFALGITGMHVCMSWASNRLATTYIAAHQIPDLFVKEK